MILDEWNKLVAEIKTNDTPENLLKLKQFVEQQAIKESQAFQQQTWQESKKQVLSSILPNDGYTPRIKENWSTLIEHIRKRLMANNGKIIKLFIYSDLWFGYLLAGSIGFGFISLLIQGYFF